MKLVLACFTLTLLCVSSCNKKTEETQKNMTTPTPDSIGHGQYIGEITTLSTEYKDTDFIVPMIERFFDVTFQPK